MLYIVVTNVDAQTRVPCIAAPMRTGPALPALDNLVIEWSNQSAWPIAMVDGVYQSAPLHFGTCDDTSYTGFPGVIETITKAQFKSRKRDEFFARKPFASWIFDEATLAWSAPVAAPQDGKQYTWNESTLAWVANTTGQ